MENVISKKIHDLAKNLNCEILPVNDYYNGKKVNGKMVQAHIEYAFPEDNSLNICHAICLQSELQRWLRDKYRIHITITSVSQESWQSQITRPGERLPWIGNNFCEDCISYEDALDCGLEIALKRIFEEELKPNDE